MTKEEQKKADMQAKHDFIGKAAKIVSSAVLSAIPPSASKTEIRLNVSNYNRYFYLHRYGQDLKIMIYRSGDIDIILREMCHADVETRLVYYSEAAKNPEITLARFHDDVKKLVSDFMNADWHIVMDFLGNYEKGKDWHAFYEENRKYYLDQGI